MGDNQTHGACLATLEIELVPCAGNFVTLHDVLVTLLHFTGRKQWQGTMK